VTPLEREAGPLWLKRLTMRDIESAGESRFELLPGSGSWLEAALPQARKIRIATRFAREEAAV
jgi:hypothetical protein